MRDIGYDFVTAVADLVDNSLAASATEIEIRVEFDGPDSHVMIADNGDGMDPVQATESLRFGSRREYRDNELGRFGLGLKTASLSQCRQVTVLTRRPRTPEIIDRTLDLDQVIESDSWLIASGVLSQTGASLRSRLTEQHGTIILWEGLDRVLPEHMQQTGWGRRRLIRQAGKLRSHLGMVFHRFLDGSISGTGVRISVNGDPVLPWDPYARSEPATEELPSKRFNVDVDNVRGSVTFTPFILPPRSEFSSPESFNTASGPLKWNRQQGLYVYRADRLIQSGGWNGLRAMDEHTKLARAALDFTPELDALFHVNVAKMRIGLPPSLKPMIERPVNELCVAANDRYRQHSNSRGSDSAGNGSSTDLREVGLAFRAAAMESGLLAEIAEIEAVIRTRSPELSKALGFK